MDVISVRSLNSTLDYLGRSIGPLERTIWALFLSIYEV